MSLGEHNHEAMLNSAGNQNFEHMSHDSSMSMGMTMYYHFGLGDLLLFKGVFVDSWLRLAIACVSIALVSMLVEALSLFNGLRCRCELSKAFNLATTRFSPSHRHDSSIDWERADNETTASTTGCRSPESVTYRRCCEKRDNYSAIIDTPYIHCELGQLRSSGLPSRLFFALSYGVQVFLSLSLMLVAMTYNVYLIVSICLGELCLVGRCRRKKKKKKKTK